MTADLGDKLLLKIALIVLTLNALPLWEEWLKAVSSQTLRSDFECVVDSESTDSTVVLAEAAGIMIHRIQRMNFNHGATREMARKLVDADIVIFMTQDAIPSDDSLIEKLVEPIISGKASLSYARQIPRSDANIFEVFPRQFNYPAESQIRGIKDVDKYGVYTFFSSDSCAAYLNSALDEIGGFQPTLASEDYFAVAKLLQKGHKVAYVAEAVVVHSHSYNLWKEFKRYFDVGYVRAENPWVQAIVGQAEGRGRDYFYAFIRELAISKPWLIPYAVINTFVKLLGYRVGFWSLNAPKWWKKMLSGQPNYWDSRYYHSRQYAKK